MSPKWTVAEQVTSTEQLQHLKEMWVGTRSRGKHGGMGCLVPIHGKAPYAVLLENFYMQWNI